MGRYETVGQDETVSVYCIVEGSLERFFSFFFGWIMNIVYLEHFIIEKVACNLL